MLNNYSIGITTFSKRYDFISKLIPQIRKYNNNKIYIIINGEKDGNFDEIYRINMLKLCLDYTSVFPIFYTETRGLSKMWNTLLIASDNDNMLILNDDIEIISEDIFNTTLNHITSNYYHGLTKINSSFSHFITNKILMEKLGFFDERLLGFGEEDGDITYRLLKIGLNVGNIGTNGVINIVSDIRHEHIKSGIGKYSNFNREFIYNTKYKSDFTSNFKGMFDTPMSEMVLNENQYPYESFFRNNKNNL
jgi:hypothetical protein